MERGLIHIYEGDGKGKTTTATGLAVRNAGYGGKVLFTQFLKDNKSSELKVLATIENVHVMLCEKPVGFVFNMTDEQKAQLREVYCDYFDKIMKTAIDENIDLLVMDEFIATYNYNFVDHDTVLNFLKNKPVGLEVVMTGRNAPEDLVELANYVSFIKKVKHPYDEGIPARKGIEK